jgi:hypothetical protein
MPTDRVSKLSKVIAVCVIAATTFACGDDDDTEEATSEATAEATGAIELPATTAAPATTASPATTAAPDTTASPDSTAAPDTTPPEGTIVTDDICTPFGSVVTLELNDRCSLEPGREPPPEELGTAFVESTIAWQVNECPGMIAVPGQVVVTVASPEELGTAVEDVRSALDDLGATIDPEALTDDAQIINVAQGIPAGDVLIRLASLQAVGRSVDLNYLEPVLPNNVFRPFDDPHAATPDQIAEFLNPAFSTEQLAVASDKAVAVIDSTGDLAVYDLDQNGYIDEDHGHGEFVSSIAARSGASVRLEPATPNSVRPGNPSVLSSGRWAPMLISDVDIIQALEAITSLLESNDVLTSIVNMSLGGVGCPAVESGFEWGIGERLALARKMDNLRDVAIQHEIALTFVAAAGNNGADVLHFPAAWRNVDVTTAYESVVSPEVSADIQDMHARLIDAIFAVGSVETPDGDPAVYSNCGAWVNAAAYGTTQVGAYPASVPGGFVPPANPDDELDPNLDYAVWSGTSFAAANFTAALATGMFEQDPTTIHDGTGARLLPDGLDCPPPT